ncbi:rCG43306 [Rattus norvegicus]|uniref:RCG43306 n=1 Tax=Rattus norvegicus TaxID=10116 RepID=A6IWE4_RAT|nr:rCG43306 [Rattus norvegicus]
MALPTTQLDLQHRHLEMGSEEGTECFLTTFTTTLPDTLGTPSGEPLRAAAFCLVQ